MQDFKEYTNVVTSYYKEKRNILHSGNNNKSIMDKNNNDIKILMENIYKNIQTSEVLDGFEKQLIHTFRQITADNKRFVFNFLIENLNKMISQQNNDEKKSK